MLVTKRPPSGQRAVELARKVLGDGRILVLTRLPSSNANEAQVATLAPSSAGARPAFSVQGFSTENEAWGKYNGEK